MATTRLSKRLVPALGLLLACGGGDLVLPADGVPTGISAGPGESQTLQFGVSTDNDSQFLIAPQISPLGTLTYTPNPLSGGATVTVTVTLGDDGGTANGGVNTSPSQTFTITITL